MVQVSPLLLPTWGMVGQLLNFFTPSLSSGSASTFLLPYSTPAQASFLSALNYSHTLTMTAAVPFHL